MMHAWDINSYRPEYYLIYIFFNNTQTTQIYTLSLHDALPISADSPGHRAPHREPAETRRTRATADERRDRKSTRLNSSNTVISYAVFCLKKKKDTIQTIIQIRGLDRKAEHHA